MFLNGAYCGAFIKAHERPIKRYFGALDGTTAHRGWFLVLYHKLFTQQPPWHWPPGCLDLARTSTISKHFVPHIKQTKADRGNTSSDWLLKLWRSVSVCQPIRWFYSLSAQLGYERPAQTGPGINKTPLKFATVEKSKTRAAEVMADWNPQPHNDLPQSSQKIKLCIVLWETFVLPGSDCDYTMRKKWAILIWRGNKN